MQVPALGGVCADVVELPLRPVVVLLQRLVPRQRLLAARAVQHVLESRPYSLL